MVSKTNYVHSRYIGEHLRTSQGVSGKKYQHLISNPQLFQYFPRESQDLFFKGTGTPAKNFGQYINNGLNILIFDKIPPLPWLQSLLDPHGTVQTAVHMETYILTNPRSYHRV